MNKISIDDASARALVLAGSLIGQGVAALRDVTLTDEPHRGSLALGDFPIGANAGAHQACEAFMEERNELRGHMEQTSAIIQFIQSYATDLASGLAEIGVSHQADPETGAPIISIDKDLFLRVAAQIA